jgi:hypothetical protein
MLSSEMGNNSHTERKKKSARFTAWLVKAATKAPTSIKYWCVFLQFVQRCRVTSCLGWFSSMYTHFVFVTTLSPNPGIISIFAHFFLFIYPSFVYSFVYLFTVTDHVTRSIQHSFNSVNIQTAQTTQNHRWNFFRRQMYVCTFRKYIFLNPGVCKCSCFLASGPTLCARVKL